MPVRAPEQHGSLLLSGQYANAFPDQAGYNTYQLFLENSGTSTIAFTKAMLGDLSLPAPTPGVLPPAFSTLTLDGARLKLSPPTDPAHEAATWWEFYPDRILEPGQTIAFQINLKGHTRSQRPLTLYDSADKPIGITIPRFRPIEKEITAITYAPGFTRMFVQYTSANTAKPVRLWVNGLPVKEFQRLPAPAGAGPHLLAFDPPAPIRPGQTLHVKLEFEDQDWRHALVRALDGIVLDAGPGGDKPTRLERRDYGLDPLTTVSRLRPDVTCDDIKASSKGGSAPDAIRERLAVLRSAPNLLTGIGYCTAMYPELWNIYGPLTDAVFAKPYRLGYGPKPERFIEDEEEDVAKAWATARPRPYLYIPESYKSRGRLLEADELELLGWLFIVKGAKGIRYQYWEHPTSGFETCPSLHDGIKTLNLELNDARTRLAPLVFVSEQALSAPCEIPSTNSLNLSIYPAPSGIDHSSSNSPNLRIENSALKIDHSSSPSTSSNTPIRADSREFTVNPSSSNSSPSLRIENSALSIDHSSSSSPSTLHPPPSTVPLKLYSSWSGDQGLILLIRNLDYITDAQPNDNGRAPRFKPAEKRNVRVSVSLPAWLRFNGVRDLLTGAPLAFEEARDSSGGQQLDLTLETMKAFRVIWIGNR